LAPVLIDDDALASRYYASNAVGAPPGKTTPGAPVPGAATASSETPGSSNFSFGLPIVNLPGRNLDQPGPGLQQPSLDQIHRPLKSTDDDLQR